MGGTPTAMPRLGLGTATLVPGYGLDAGLGPVDGLALVRHALRCGMRYFDTAASYGAGESILGAVADEIRSAGARVATKLTPAELRSGTVVRSLERLAHPRLDTLLVHSASEQDLADERLGSELALNKVSGILQHAGASTYGAEAAVAALRQPWCDVVQVEHSILNPSVVREAVRVRRPGQQIVVRSVLCKGLLTDRRSVASLSAESRQILEALDGQARVWGWSLAALAIRFALDTPDVEVVLVGASTPAEIDVAVAAAQAPALTPAQMEALSQFDRSRESWTHPETWK
jgi:aryl-alcohol dehydrogenase-like predicted oxidoreductase